MSDDSLLLHICCAGCGAYAGQALKSEGFKVAYFFYNPNIHPESEHSFRLQESEGLAKRFGMGFIAGRYRHDDWLLRIKGTEKEKEKGRRCLLCYEHRLEKTAQAASGFGYRFFASTLTVSPHKLAKEISRIGRGLADKHKVDFLDRDFKKQEGFKRSVMLSKELGLYRQNYCGCEFSRR